MHVVSTFIPSFAEGFQHIVAAARTDSEESFWMVFLIIAIAAAVALLWYSSRKKAIPSGQDTDVDDADSSSISNFKFQISNRNGSIPGNSASPSIPVVTIPSRSSRRKAAQQNVDLQSGIELLDLDFLCHNVKNIELKDTTSIAIRRLCFRELARRNSLGCLDGVTLKVYAKNADGLFDKTIQCQALTALAGKTPSQSERIEKILVARNS